jgi:hypothetical protein
VPFIDWKRVYADLEKAPENRTEPFYTQLVKEWLTRLSGVVGTPTSVLESDTMIYFTYFEGKVARERFGIITNVRSTLVETFGSIVPDSYLGKNVIVELADLDFYYRYVSYFYPKLKEGDDEQTFAQSSGIMCSDGYLQVVLNHYAKASLSLIVAHELTHLLMAYYRPPLWLNEGLATLAETIFSQGRSQFTNQGEYVDPWSWSKESFAEFLTGQLMRNYEANFAFYQLAFMIVYEMRSEKGDLPRLLKASRETGDVEKVLMEATGKRIVDFAPVDVRKALGEPIIEPSDARARKRR